MRGKRLQRQGVRRRNEKRTPVDTSSLGTGRLSRSGSTGSSSPITTRRTPTSSSSCNDAACAGGNEKIATLDSAGDVGQYSALQIGVDSVPVVAYLDVTNSKLEVARPSLP